MLKFLLLLYNLITSLNLTDESSKIVYNNSNFRVEALLDFFFYFIFLLKLKFT